MRKRLAMVLMACAALTMLSPRAAHAQVNISAGIQINAVADFNTPLEPYGSWVEVGSYGRCWHPRGVAVDWQPYTVGYWESTDAGWYWQSDEPWAWACYHYGSWYDDPSIGWVWIPGIEWAPAWVTWRDSDDYIGWAPCGPRMSILAPSFFVFCDIHRFHDHFHSRHDFVVNNTTIINRTRVVNNFDRRTIDVNGRQRTISVNRGPSVEQVQRATGAKFTPRPVRDVFVQSHHPDNARRDEGRAGQRNAEQQRQGTPSPTGRDQQRNYQEDHQRQFTPGQAQQQQQPHATPAPSGSEQQQRNIQQQQQQHTTPAPTGREQQRNYQQQQQGQEQQNLQRQQQLEQKQQSQRRTPEPAVHPEQRTPPTQPEQRHDVTPPTGRETPRVYPETPKPTPVEPKKEMPTPPQHPNGPQERPLPPTGREDVPHSQPREVTPPSQPREVTPPAARQAPIQHPQQAPTDGGHRDGDGHDGHDGH